MMALPHSRGFCKIKFFSAIALGCSITAICFASSAAQSVGDPIVTGESGGRLPFVNNNLQSQLKLNPETADYRDRLSGDLYSGSELDSSKEPETDIPEFAAAAPSQEPETLAQLPNRGDNRQEIPIPNPVLPNSTHLPEPAPRTPLPPIEQLLLPVPVPRRTEELPNIPGTITVDRFEVVGSTVFSKQELDAALKNFVGRPLTFAELLSPGADARGKTRVSALRLLEDFTQRGERDVLVARSHFNLGVSAFGATASNSEPDGQFLTWRGQLQYVRLLAPQTLLVVRSQAQLAGGELLPIEQFGLGGPDTVRGYRQDALVADSGLFASAELRYPILRTGDKKGILQVTPFVDAGNVWNSGEGWLWKQILCYQRD
ncbi:ShlB/FhaC/HecB family hemolysin secretion/activation protein [Microcoleus sp. CAWBG58]|uniref:ShlB/FhaC/HecB family hemolysin secretion/activation protein n=1 Tax=Microcoleus sp. CAWBG58 TaxID=2841651 RepID=UPI002600DCF1|nr:ShlB/FhaC/HecB family hemolysin secretion/activation protein [Microcoleus sp. CAWBG58]